MSRPKILPQAGAEKIICAGCLLLILIHLVASYFPRERLWGLNLFYYLPPIWRWILVVSGLLILIPRVNNVVSNSLSSLFRSVSGKAKRVSKYHKYAFFSLIGGGVFWVLRVKSYLLGDSFLRAREINLGGSFSSSAPLDFLLHVEVARLLNWDAFRTYAVLSVLAGMAFLYLILLLGDMMGKDRREKWLAFLLVITMGTSQLFFGYVESYTLVYVAMVGYVLLCLGYLKSKNGLALPVFAFLLAFSLHVSALTLLPSLVYLIFSRLVLSAGLIMVLGIGLFLLQSHDPERKGLSSYLISPLGSGEDSYSLVSPSHLVDLINHQLLVSPAAILILVASILTCGKKISLKERTTAFLLLVSLCTLGYALLVDPKLGYPRDWDLFAFTGLGYTLLALHVFLRYWRETKMVDLRYITLSLLFVSLISTAPWIYVNASEEKAVQRCVHLLDLDEERSAYGRENVAMYYSNRGEWEKEIEHWEKAAALTGSARYITNLAVAYGNLQEYDLALKELERSLEADSAYHFTYFVMGELLVAMGRYEEAVAGYRKAAQLKPDITQYSDNLGALLSNLGRHQEAIEAFEEGLRANPGYPPIYRNLGYTCFNCGEHDRAEKYLKLYLQLSPGVEDEAEVRQVLRNVQQERLQEPIP
jgi:tetratricopeptide (TPR) repeat protein